ncbi:hypothetical protein BV210_05320 [Halorientalis sp. IM1011]|uniref:DUF7283 family protein n=1 Tax=Halorientalis sp. IM1011 TaxID=1932360 RepID=UPI00097CCB8A|nr:hypothetical protein [Halorientalis sp. IM1011]AQL42165.1 hypothetical protein BV210_05320 [Halorientalis sp. IM1011]
MDFEAPADAWYVFLGVSLVSVAMAGVALGLPSAVPPDANAAANTVDRVAASTQNASASYDHDADRLWVGTKRIRMESEDGGSAEESISFGQMVFVRHDDDGKLTEVLHGAPPTKVYSGASPGPRDAFQDDIEHAKSEMNDEARNDEPDWWTANGQLRVRKVNWRGVSVTLVDG